MSFFVFDFLSCHSFDSFKERNSYSICSPLSVKACASFEDGSWKMVILMILAILILKNFALLILSIRLVFFFWLTRDGSFHGQMGLI